MPGKPAKSLRLTRCPSGNWLIDGTFRGVRVDQSSGTRNKQAAEKIRVELEQEILAKPAPGKAPRYMRWYRHINGYAVLRTCIVLKSRTNGKTRICEKSLDTGDSELAKVKIIPVIEQLIAASEIGRDSQVAKLYLDRTIREADVNRGTPSTKAPPCMTWCDGVDLPDGQAWQRRGKGVTRVLTSQIFLRDGNVLKIVLNTSDPKLAAKRLAPEVRKAIAEGKLSPYSKPARLYGGAETIPPSDSDAAPIRGTKPGRTKHPGGRRRKWKITDGIIPDDDAKLFFEAIRARHEPGGSVTAAIEKAEADNEIPSSFRRLKMKTKLNRYGELLKAQLGR